MYKKEMIGRGITYFVLIVLFITVAYPLFWTLSTSIRENWDVFKNPISFPMQPTFQNYQKVWTLGRFESYFFNSIIITSVSLIGVLFLSAAAGYGFARYRFKGSNGLFFLFMFSLVIVSSSIMIAQYRVITIFGLLNTLTGIILVYLSWTAYGIIMFRQAFSDIPDDIIDAAVIDGCKEYQIFYRIAFPLLRPTIATVAIFTFVWIWNDFIWPLILLQDPRRETVTLGIMTQRGQFLSDWAVLTAGLSIGFLPVLILYFLFQKQFIQGITMGSLKE